MGGYSVIMDKDEVLFELHTAKNHYFVALTFGVEDEGEVVEVPLCWITQVGRSRFSFKPGLFQEISSPIDSVVDIQRPFDARREAGG